MLYYPQVSHSIGGNTAGVLANISTGTYLLAGGNNLTLSQQANTITISQQPPIFQFWQNQEGGNSTSGVWVASALALVPFDVGENLFNGYMTAKSFLLNVSGGTGLLSLNYSFTVSVGIYTIYSATNLSLINSASSSWGRVSGPSNSTLYAGPRWFSVDATQFSTALAFSQTNYVLGLVYSSNTTLVTAPTILNVVGQSYFGSGTRSGTIMQASSTNLTLGWGLPFLGLYTTTTGGLPSTLAYSDIQKAGDISVVTQAKPNLVPHFVLNNLTGVI